MIQDSFRVQFCIKDIACKEDVDKWLSKLATSSNIKYNTESGGHARKGKRVLFAGQYICQCKRKKLTKRQEDAKKKAQQRKQLRRQAHPMNTTEDQFDLLSKNRDKKTDCQSKMSVKIFTKCAIKLMKCVKLNYGGTTITASTAFTYRVSALSFHQQRLPLRIILRWVCLPQRPSTTMRQSLCRILCQ